jgi:hypothetical protein
MVEIKLFLFILSCLYSLKYIVQFIVRLKEPDPKPIVINNVSQVLLYLGVAYIITFILT